PIAAKNRRYVPCPCMVASFGSAEPLVAIRVHFRRHGGGPNGVQTEARPTPNAAVRGEERRGLRAGGVVGAVADEVAPLVTREVAARDVARTALPRLRIDVPPRDAVVRR